MKTSTSKAKFVRIVSMDKFQNGISSHQVEEITAFSSNKVFSSVCLKILMTISQEDSIKNHTVDRDSSESSVFYFLFRKVTGTKIASFETRRFQKTS